MLLQQKDHAAGASCNMLFVISGCGRAAAAETHSYRGREGATEWSTTCLSHGHQAKRLNYALRLCAPVTGICYVVRL